MSQRSYTKNEYILDPQSDWNQAGNDEPVFVVRATNWRAVIFLAALVTAKEATGWCLNVAERMKNWVEENEVPYEPRKPTRARQPQPDDFDDDIPF